MKKSRKSLRFLVIVTLVASFSLKADSPKYAPPQNMDLYLCIGQSNMAGRAPFSGEDADVIENCYLLNGEEKWEPAKNPLNRYSTIRKELKIQKMGPSYMFAKTMLSEPNSKPIGLIVNAKGGTSINLWLKDTKYRQNGATFYEEALRRTKIARQNGTLKGILWHQGETDRQSSKYLEKLKKLIADLREDLSAPNLPFVAGQMTYTTLYDDPAKGGRYNEHNNGKFFNEQILKLPDEVPNTAVVSSEGLKTLDRWHFDTPSVKKLGIRYAEKMKMLQKNSGKTEK